MTKRRTVIDVYMGFFLWAVRVDLSISYLQGKQILVVHHVDEGKFAFKLRFIMRSNIMNIIISKAVDISCVLIERSGNL